MQKNTLIDLRCDCNQSLWRVNIKSKTCHIFLSCLFLGITSILSFWSLWWGFRV